MIDFAHVCSVKSDRIAVALAAVHVRVLVVALLRLYVLYQVQSNAFPIVRPGIVLVRRLGSSHVQWPVAAVVVVVYTVARESVPLLLPHFLFVLSHEFPFREVLLVLLVVQHFGAGVHLLDAELRWHLVIIVGDVNVVVVVQVHAGRVRVGVDERGLRLDVVSNVLPILVDDVVGMLELIRRRLSRMAGIVELLLLLLQLHRLLLLLLSVLRRVAALFAFSFTLPFLVIRCALRGSSGRREENESN